MISDLHLPGKYGLEVIREVKAVQPEQRVLVLTSQPDADLPAQLIAAGVHGFVDKTEPLDYVLQAIESVMKGGMYFATHVPPKSGVGGVVSPEALAVLRGLSEREIEVARLVS